jgi:replicative DNA helicase
MSTTYDAAFQNKIVAMALRDQAFAQRVEGLLAPSHFDQEAHSYLIDLANTHYATYRTTPDSAIVIKTIKDAKAAKTLKDDFVDELKRLLKIVYSPAADLSNRDYMVDEVSKFARERAVEEALSKGIDILDAKGNFTEIEKLIQSALAVGATEGTGAVSFADSVADRCKARVNRLAGGKVKGITTGHREIDELLYHKGWGKKEMVVLMGAAKSGKSMGLSHFALNAYQAGFKVLYITCENSADVTCDRLDACLAGVPLKDLDTASVSVQGAVIAASMKGGLLEVQEFPMGQCKVSDIRRLINKFKAKGIIFDLLVVDYADEMDSERKYNDERHKYSEIYTGLRGLGTEENLAVLTATQTNRTGAKATTATGTDVAEDFGKVRKADAFITINATEDEKKAGQMRLYFSHMRNSESGITVHCAQDRSRMKFISRVVKVA